MASCNYEEFTVAKVGNSFCNFVHFYFTTNILPDDWYALMKLAMTASTGIWP